MITPSGQTKYDESGNRLQILVYLPGYFQYHQTIYKPKVHTCKIFLKIKSS